MNKIKFERKVYKSFEKECGWSFENDENWNRKIWKGIKRKGNRKYY